VQKIATLLKTPGAETVPIDDRGRTASFSASSFVFGPLLIVVLLIATVILIPLLIVCLIVLVLLLRTPKK
jgi:hypothetical protein